MSNLPNKKFSMKSTLMIIKQSLERLKEIHEKGIIHRDMKPENLCIGYKGKEKNIYLIDFGLSKIINNDKKNLYLLNIKKEKIVIGTVRYISMNAHLGNEQYKKDDLESLAYMMIYFIKGELPWQNLKAKSRKEKYTKIYQKNANLMPHNKKISKDSRGYGLKQIAKMTLGSGNIDLAVELPKGEDLNEWLAVNTIEFYNDINLLYGMLVEFCTKESCPVMSAGPKYEYLWADGSNVKTPMKVSAGEYIEFLMVWVENQLNNENIFPSVIGVPFPKNFLQIIKVIFKRLFRVYAHIYYTHFPHIVMLGCQYHLNTCFKHFIFFIERFNLVEAKELAPLADLIQKFKERRNEQAGK